MLETANAYFDGPPAGGPLPEPPPEVLGSPHPRRDMPARGAGILVVEDDKHIQRSITYQLTRQGYRVSNQYDGEAGLEDALRNRYAVVVVDVMLPRLDGLSLCKELRQAHRDQPIILISARGSDLDKITGLEFGADDYVAKPFSPAELEARIRALRRRAGGLEGEAQPKLSFKRLTLDRDRHVLRVGEKIVRLTPKELALVRILMSQPERIFPRDALLSQIWGVAYEGYYRAIDAHISRLKNKMVDIGESPEWFEGVYGVGYRMRDPEAQ